MKLPKRIVIKSRVYDDGNFYVWTLYNTEELNKKQSILSKIINMFKKIQRDR